MTIWSRMCGCSCCWLVSCSMMSPPFLAWCDLLVTASVSEERTALLGRRRVESPGLGCQGAPVHQGLVCPLQIFTRDVVPPLVKGVNTAEQADLSHVATGLFEKCLCKRRVLLLAIGGSQE